jgi:hypothetical protein
MRELPLHYRIVTEQYGDLLDVRIHETREALQRDLDTIAEMKSIRIVSLTEIVPSRSVRSIP